MHNTPFIYLADNVHYVISRIINPSPADVQHPATPTLSRHTTLKQQLIPATQDKVFTLWTFLATIVHHVNESHHNHTD